LVDAPVSGGGQRAAERALLVMVGGDPEALERCRPVIETYGQPVIHLGPVGSGQSAKLMNNLLFTAHLALGTRAFALARALDIEPGGLARVLEAGSGASAALGVLAGTGYTAAGVASRAGPLLRKDTQLVVDLARSVGATLGILGDAADDALATMGHRRDAPE
jgi:3-hydroxyisobutyrate dehydrogenase-like beta-hydroxyacid dehydrogenase